MYPIVNYITPVTKMMPAKDDSLSFNLYGAGGHGNAQTEMIQSLLFEIIRVKDLIKYYEEIPNDSGKLGASILTELVSEAYTSLVNYDTELIRKYYDLLKNCD